MLLSRVEVVEMRVEKSSSPGPLESVAFRVLLGSLAGMSGVEACLAAEESTLDAATQDNFGFAFDALAERLIAMAAPQLE
jgi:hypothetical protein